MVQCWLTGCVAILFKWLDDNHMRESNGKSYLLFNSNLLTIEYQLNFDEPVSQVYDKTCKKLCTLVCIFIFYQSRTKEASKGSRSEYCPQSISCLQLLYNDNYEYEY